MGFFVIISFLLLGLAAFVIHKKQRFDQVDTLHLLFASAVAIFIKADFADEQAANTWTYALIAVLAVNFLLSRWAKLRKPFLRIAPPIITFAMLLGIFWNDSFVYLGRNFNVSDKATLVLPFIGILIYEVSHLSMSFLQRFFGMRDTAENMLMALFVGIAALIGVFNAEGYGVFLVAVGFAAASFFNNFGSKHVLHSLLAISLVWFFANANNIQTIDIRFSKVLGGLFVGGFVALLLQQVWTLDRRKNLALAFSYGFAAMAFIGMIDFGTRIHPAFGGVEAFLGGLIGFAIANSVVYFHDRKEHVHQAPIMMSGLAIILVIGIVFPPLYVNEEEEAIMKTLEMKPDATEEGEEPQIAYIPLDGLTGKYEVQSKESVISFELGPDGSVTKGAIKNFTGSFNFAEDLTKTSFDIKLPVENLTTFIPMRDRSLMEETYFHEEKYPFMRYKGSELVATSEKDGYEMIGQFEMLGKKKEQKVILHRVEEDGKTVLVGSGEIDRRDFGMADDPREGNVVKFGFKVEITK